MQLEDKGILLTGGAPGIRGVGQGSASLTRQHGERPSAAPAVEARDVDFAFGRRTVLKGLSLSVPPGIAFGILGANGAGKTTLVRLLVGLLRPRSGEVRVLGEPPSPALTRRIGYMPQLGALYLALSARENLEFFARMCGMSNRRERREAVARALHLVGLSGRAGDPVSSLSGGMRQRVSLAVALVHKPPLLLLDEPTVGLDPELRASFWDHFKAMTREGVTLLISSHTMDDAAHCDRLGFLRGGRFIAEGTPAELRATTGRAGASLEEAFLHLIRRDDAGTEGG
ncbi:MAG: ABC transporter ATP-binding protein [Gemmatimonadetes bacterium]|nr:ABC transporter ATP-binding protein [Gemmatimonadota bacterium]